METNDDDDDDGDGDGDAASRRVCATPSSVGRSVGRSVGGIDFPSRRARIRVHSCAYVYVHHAQTHRQLRIRPRNLAKSLPGVVVVDCCPRFRLSRESGSPPRGSSWSRSRDSGTAIGSFAGPLCLVHRSRSRRRKSSLVDGARRLLLPLCSSSLPRGERVVSRTPRGRRFFVPVRLSTNVASSVRIFTLRRSTDPGSLGSASSSPVSRGAERREGKALVEEEEGCRLISSLVGYPTISRRCLHRRQRRRVRPRAARPAPNCRSYSSRPVRPRMSLWRARGVCWRYARRSILWHIRDSKGSRRTCDLPCALDLIQWKRTLFCILQCTFTYLPTHSTIYRSFRYCVSKKSLFYRPEK